jgi:hypothetical protein
VNRFHGAASIVMAMIVIAGAGAFSTNAWGQESAHGQFQLTQATHWENAVLPEGKYQYTVEAGRSRPVVRVRQVDGAFSGMFIPKVPMRQETQEQTEIVLHEGGDGMYVSSFHVRGLQGALEFSIPGKGDGAAFRPAGPEAENEDPDAASRDTEASRMFKIVNPARLNLSIAGAEKVYLNACRLIEEQFNRSAPVRPQVILHLGAGENEVRYPNNEIMLKKWDEFRFAQAVVEIALHELVSTEERIKISDQAVNLANTTVSVCDLKNCRN